MVREKKTWFIELITSYLIEKSKLLYAHMETFLQTITGHNNTQVTNKKISTQNARIHISKQHSIVQMVMHITD